MDVTLGITLSKPINVAQIPQKSLFRYPGGKTWLIPWVRRWLGYWRPNLIIEPFAGSGIVALTAVAEGFCERAVIIELDQDVSSVWKTVLKGDAEWLMDRISQFDFNYDNVAHVIRTEPDSIEERAFRTIVHNRSSRGGIMAEGAGLLKNGENGKGIASRWYPETLIKRIQDIISLKDRIKFIDGDAFAFMDSFLNNPESALFLDPPYTVTGQRLYNFNEINHHHLFSLAAMHAGPSLLTYDDSAKIRNLAHRNDFRFRRIMMQNAHLAQKKELLISKNFKWLPKNKGI